jgi:16S rRNA (uracil1498-N3)-methyltransferase
MAQSRARLYSPEHAQQEEGSLTGDAFHYLRHVLRVRTGDRVILFSPEPYESLCEIVGIEAEEVRFKRIESRRVETESPLDLTLAVAVGKGKKVEDILESATALGIHEYIPFVADRSVAKRSNPRLLERLQAIAHSACRQSGRTSPPVVREVQPNLKSAMEQFLPSSQRCFFDEAGGMPVVEAVGKIDPASPVCLLFGPEGGWSPQERCALVEAGSIPLTLGRRILRMELAALVGVSLVENLLSARASHLREAER